MIRMGATSSTSWAPPGLPGSGALLGVAAGRELVARPSFGLAGLGAASRGASGWWGAGGNEMLLFLMVI